MAYTYDSYRDYHQKEILPIPYVIMGSLIFIVVGVLSLAYNVLIKEPLIAIGYIVVGAVHLVFPQKSNTWFKHRDIVGIEDGKLTWSFYKNRGDVNISEIASISRSVGTLGIHLKNGDVLSMPIHKIYSKEKYDEFVEVYLPQIKQAL